MALFVTIQSSLCTFSGSKGELQLAQQSQARHQSGALRHGIRSNTKYLPVALDPTWLWYLPDSMLVVGCEHLEDPLAKAVLSSHWRLAMFQWQHLLANDYKGCVGLRLQPFMAMVLLKRSHTCCWSSFTQAVALGIDKSPMHC